MQGANDGRPGRVIEEEKRQKAKKPWEKLLETSCVFRAIPVNSVIIQECAHLIITRFSFISSRQVDFSFFYFNKSS